MEFCWWLQPHCTLLYMVCTTPRFLQKVTSHWHGGCRKHTQVSRGEIKASDRNIRLLRESASPLCFPLPLCGCRWNGMLSREESAAADGEETKGTFCPSSLPLLLFHAKSFTLSLAPSLSAPPPPSFPSVHFHLFALSLYFPLSSTSLSSLLFLLSLPSSFLSIPRFVQDVQCTLLKSDLSLCLWRLIELGCQGFHPSRGAKLQLHQLKAPIWVTAKVQACACGFV